MNALTHAELIERIRVLESLVMSLGDKLLTCAEHLGRLAERKDSREALAHEHAGPSRDAS